MLRTIAKTSFQPSQKTKTWINHELNPGISAGKPLEGVRYLGTMNNFGSSLSQPTPSSARRSSIGSFPLMEPGGLQQRRQKFTLVSKDELPKLQAEKELELVGFHGTARWVANRIEADGVETGLTGKHRGGISAAGTGLYTARGEDPAKPEDIEKAKLAAGHYARRASVSEPFSFDLDTRQQIIAVFRVPSNKLRRATMPTDILGKAEKIKEFRDNNPAHEYDLEGNTPLPRRLSEAGITAKTTLISDEGLTSDDVEYIAVRIDPAPKKE